MRRPRSKLQVSTFPFLAVLLCAMGSLLLLLFIMDRRAKIAAQHTVSAAVAERTKRSQAEEEAWQAQWEKAKDLLHHSLLEQQNQLLGDAKGLQQNLDDANKKLAIVQTQHLDLDGKIKGETAQISTLQAQIGSQRAGLSETAQKEIKSKAELIEAAKELAELERVFRQLKALRESEKQTYSVVPYRGKRGDLRAPIYVECIRGGVIFHPEKKLLQGWEFTADSLRGEVERSAGPLALEKTSKDKSRTLAEERKGPYVLFLIRPDGIATYYKAQSALKGYQLDFGYELVDENWVLDFNADPDTRPAPPVAIAKTGDPRPPGVPLFPALGGNGSGQGGSPGAPAGNIGAPPVGFGTPPTAGIGSSSLPSAPPSGFGPPPIAGIGGSGLPSAPPDGFGPPPIAGLGSPGLPSAPPTDIGNPSYGGINAGIPSRTPAFVPINKLPLPIAIASSESDGIAPLGNPSNPPSGGGGAEPGLASPNIPIPGNSGLPKRSNPAGQDGGGTESDGSPALSTVKGVPTFGAGAAKKPPPVSPLSKMLGNKDFVITIDCYTGHVTVFPSGLQYRWTSTNAVATDQALIQTVTNLIARRQASVRPGEPPYRPLIRFQVSADGLRTYLHVYPLLEHLRVPMTRENVED